MQAKTHHWRALGRSVMNLNGAKSPTGLYLSRIAQVGKDAPLGTADLIELAPAMALALQSALQGNLGPCRAILPRIPEAFKLAK